MKFQLAALACALGSMGAQQPGHQKQDATLPISYQTCTTAGGCTSASGSVVLDSNWDWVHKEGTYTNCYTGDEWDQTICPDPATCAQNCGLDAGTVQDYESVYGISTSGDALTLDFVTVQQYGTNVGSRTYLMDSPSTYKMFKLLNQEFTFDVDVSKLPCGLNGALYFVEMDQDGGMAKYPNNKAGAMYGTGYCDAQCPHDIKFINGEANILNWTASGPSTGTGHYGTCCHEMDIWESNSISQAVTAHPCSTKGQYRCEGTECGDDATGERDDGVCDKDGCDLATYRLGATDFFGPGSNFTLDSTKVMTVVTQFITTDGTANGDLKEIRREYVQDGKTIASPTFTVGGAKHDSITDDFCTAQKKTFGDNNTFANEGGMKVMGEALGRGMVLVMSLWDDHDVHMLWLDSEYPPTKPASAPGVARGTCATTSGNPADVEKNSPDANVIFSNIRVGDIGSTVPTAKPSPAPTPTPAPAPGAQPSPSSPPASGCPGGSLKACMELCPSNPPKAFQACVQVCEEKCP